MKVITYDTTIKCEDEETGKVKLMRVCNTCRIESLCGESELHKYLIKQNRAIGDLIKGLGRRGKGLTML